MKPKGTKIESPIDPQHKLLLSTLNVFDGSQKILYLFN
jgi:hypothetical protein